MKKFITLLGLILGISAFLYYYYSAPRILERRLAGLIKTLDYSAVSLENQDKDAEHFASYFAPSVTLSGADNFLEGEADPDTLSRLYSENYRNSAKSISVQLSEKPRTKLKSAKLAEMTFALRIDIRSLSNFQDQREIPCHFQWEKTGGKWKISKIILLDPEE